MNREEKTHRRSGVTHAHIQTNAQMERNGDRQGQEDGYTCSTYVTTSTYMTCNQKHENVRVGQAGVVLIVGKALSGL